MVLQSSLPQAAQGVSVRRLHPHGCWDVSVEVDTVAWLGVDGQGAADGVDAVADVA